MNSRQISDEKTARFEPVGRLCIISIDLPEAHALSTVKTFACKGTYQANIRIVHQPEQSQVDTFRYSSSSECDIFRQLL